MLFTYKLKKGISATEVAKKSNCFLTLFGDIVIMRCRQEPNSCEKNLLVVLDKAFHLKIVLDNDQSSVAL